MPLAPSPQRSWELSEFYRAGGHLETITMGRLGLK